MLESALRKLLGGRGGLRWSSSGEGVGQAVRHFDDGMYELDEGVAQEEGVMTGVDVDVGISVTVTVTGA